MSLFTQQYSDDSFHEYNPKNKIYYRNALNNGTHHLVKRECLSSCRKVDKHRRIIVLLCKYFQIKWGDISNENFLEMQT